MRIKERSTQEMDKQGRTLLAAAIRDAWQERASKGQIVVAGEVADTVMKGLAALNAEQWCDIRDQIVLDSITHMVSNTVRQVIASANPAQPWLPLPEFEHIPQFVQLDGGSLDLVNATLEQYRKYQAALDTKIRSYGYARRTEARAKQDRLELKEMRRLDRVLAPYFAGNPAMTMGRAAKLHQEYLESPVVQRNRRLASAGGKAKNRFHAKATT
jgi:hypothetical protein